MENFVPNLNVLFALCPLIFLAGFIDSIAGGGGLISLTSYLAFGLPGTYALGTNKFGSVIGCTAASANYIRTKNFDLRSLIPAVLAAFPGSVFGSRLALRINQRAFGIIMLIAAPVVAVFVFFQKDSKTFSAKIHSKAFVMTLSALVGFAVGFYDGFYGAGAGTFYQIGFAMVAGIEAKKACGNARLANLASNLAALTTFIINGRVVYSIALPCAAFSILGNILGSRLAIKKDIKIIRPMMLVAVGLLTAKLCFDLFFKR